MDQGLDRHVLRDIAIREFGQAAYKVLGETKMDLTALVRDKAVAALQKIKTIIEDDSLEDFDCVEQIVCVFEEIGSGGGNRHDFG